MNTFWKKYIDITYRAIAYFGASIIGIYIIFQLIALRSPFFQNRWIFQFFDVGREANVPTYFSVLIFLLMGIAAFVIAGYHQERGMRSWPWVFLGLLLLFLGLDELGQVHEQLTWHTQNLLGTGGFLAFAWIIPYGIIVGAMSLYFIPFLWKLSYGKYLFAGALVFVTGALGVEMIGAYFYDIYGIHHAGFIIASSVEELMEITGLLIALYGFKEQTMSYFEKT
ncbi:MAG: hypothetical protein LRY46_01545 [Candidatus Pacebacteria bacterium]|nr:hypothetical protein [Candidatus Paceibacterota bacterium]MCD8563515.1 hypothetical protein [Candidatus Paceibacterota bacterium]